MLKSCRIKPQIGQNDGRKLCGMTTVEMKKKIVAGVPRALVIAGLALSVAACTDSGRFSEFGSPSRSAVAPPPPPQRQPTFTPAPAGTVQTSQLPPVSSQPLPPPGSGPARPPSTAGLPPEGASVPIDPEQAPRPSRANPPDISEPAAPAPAPQVAARPPAPAPAASGPPTRTSVTGNWSAREAAGNACRVTLSSTPTLDLYKASSSGCQSRDLQRVSAWELRGEEIYLYEPGGGVAARLKKSGNSFEGSAAKSGAPITLSK
jgi:hypothetical protein